MQYKYWSLNVPEAATPAATAVTAPPKNKAFCFYISGANIPEKPDSDPTFQKQPDPDPTSQKKNRVRP